jgi:hypothetical protein
MQVPPDAGDSDKEHDENGPTESAHNHFWNRPNIRSVAIQDNTLFYARPVMRKERIPELFVRIASVSLQNS